MRTRPALLAFTLLLPFFLLLAAPATAVVLRPSDILVLGASDVGSGVIRIDPVTGAQTLVSAHPSSPITIKDFTVDRESRLFAIVGDTVALIDAATGAQSTVIASGHLTAPVAIAVGNDRAVFVVDRAALDGAGALFRFDPDTGVQSIVSAGGILNRALDMEISTGGVPVVIHSCLSSCFPDSPFGNAPARIDVVTGSQSPIPGGIYFTLSGLGSARDYADTLVIANSGNATFIYRFNIETGEVSVVGSTAACSGQDCRELFGSVDSAIDQSGRLLLTGVGLASSGPPLPPGLYDATLYYPISVGNFSEIQVVPGILGTVGFDLTGETGSFATDFAFLSEPLIARATGTKNGVPALVQQNRKGLGVTQNGTSGPFLQDGETLSLDFGDDAVEPVRFVLWFQNGGFPDPFTLTIDVDGAPVAYDVVDGAGQEFQTFEVEGGRAGRVMRFTGGLYSAFRVTEITVKDPEAPGGPACGLGFELALLLPPLLWLEIRRRRD